MSFHKFAPISLESLVVKLGRIGEPRIFHCSAVITLSEQCGCNSDIGAAIISVKPKHFVPRLKRLLIISVIIKSRSPVNHTPEGSLAKYCYGIFCGICRIKTISARLDSSSRIEASKLLSLSPDYEHKLAFFVIAKNSPRRKIETIYASVLTYINIDDR